MFLESLVHIPPSSHNHDDRYYTETEINNLIASVKNEELILSFSRITKTKQNFKLSKSITSFKNIIVFLQANGYKASMLIPVSTITGVSRGPYIMQSIFNLEQYFVAAEINFTTDNNYISGHIVATGSDSGYSTNVDIFVYGIIGA